MRAISLSHVEFDIVWESLRLGERPYPIDIRAFGETVGERDALRGQVLADLGGQGLHNGRDLDPRLEDLLVLLVRNQVTVDGQFAVGSHLRVLAAARGDYGVLAVQTEDEVRLAPVRGSGLVASVVGLLPDAKPGPGGAVSLPKQVFHDAVDAFAQNGFTAFETVLNSNGVTGRDMRAIATLVESARSGGGQLAANSVDQVGRRTRTEVLNWFDTAAGRYLVHTHRDRNRVEWTTFAPADSARLAQRLADLVGSVRQ